VEEIIGFITSPLKIGETVLTFSIVELLVTLVVPIVFSIIFYRILLLLIKRLLNQSQLNERLKENIYKWIRIILRIFIAVLFVVLLARLFGAEMFTYLGKVFSFLGKPFYESGSTKISVTTILLTIPVFYLATWLSKIVKRFLENTPVTSNLDPSRRFSLLNLARYLVTALAIIVGLSIIGINVSSLAVLFGVLGVGLGFGLQGVVANFFAGLVIIVTRPIKEGDRIYINGMDGTVITIRLISSVINTLTNETIIIPNSQIVDNSVHNYSYNDKRIIIKNDVQVSYNSDLDKVIEVLTAIAERNPYKLPKSNITVRVVSFDDSGITMSLWTWIGDASEKYAALSWCNLEIWRVFKNNDIEIPFPQVDVHMKKTKKGQIGASKEEN
jgi:potassium-dependent mechanosensitive channel